MTEVTSEAQLRELIGAPLSSTVARSRSHLHDYDTTWLARSPLCLVATCHSDGTCDVSPKGDPPGFTVILDDRTIAIPERPGNRRADSLRNILTNPRVGLIYLIPGRGDTLRINGRARLVRDGTFFDRMTVQGHRPALAIIVAIDEVFYHCSKAFLRSDFWKPATWEPEALPSRAQIVKGLERHGGTDDDLERQYGPTYTTPR